MCVCVCVCLERYATLSLYFKSFATSANILKRATLHSTPSSPLSSGPTHGLKQLEKKAVSGSRNWAEEDFWMQQQRGGPAKRGESDKTDRSSRSWTEKTGGRQSQNLKGLFKQKTEVVIGDKGDQRGNSPDSLLFSARRNNFLPSLSSLPSLSLSPDMGRLLALTLAHLAYLLATAIASERQQHHVQHGPCSYTFILPEVEHCHPLKDFQVTNTLQRDSPPEAEPDTSQSKPGKAQKERPSWQERKLENLESAMENNTQWLQKLENFIQENVRSGMEEMKRTAVHTQTAAMLEMGTNLLSQSAEQTRKLTDVETQVLNQTSRLEIQLLEYSLFTNRLEKHILLQTQEISRLSDKNSFLEQRLLALEARYGKELQGMQSEKQQLQELLERQSRLVSQLQGELGSSTLNSTLLQRQQAVLTDTVQQLLAMVNHCNEISNTPKEEPLSFRDCAEILRSGVTESGIYSIRLPNSTQTVKVFCDMKTSGGGWTVLQHRRNGSVNFHRGWKDYKMGFGEPSGEHWLGNDIIHKLTSSQEYSLHVQLKDREGNEAFSHYDRFYIDGEDNNYSLHAEGFSGTAGRTSSLTHTGTQFSTKDRDNDRCTCKCAQLASGGWWFEACGPSNLNGIYYPSSSSVIRYNGIKWYYWKGPNLMATMTTMMVRPANF